jgi:hypothetical protein
MDLQITDWNVGQPLRRETEIVEPVEKPLRRPVKTPEPARTPDTPKRKKKEKAPA